MEELAVIPECFVDTCLTETITSATGFNHQKGCGTVCRLMQGKFADKFALGIVDKDKQQLTYLKEFTLLGSKESIFLYKHNEKSHYIIQINPAIERFILKAAEEKNIDLLGYGLPGTLGELTKITKKETSKRDKKFKTLFDDLSDTSEFCLLAKLIKYIASNRYQCDVEFLKSQLS